MKRIFDLFGNHRIWIIIGIIISNVSCFRIADSCHNWQQMSIADVIATCFYFDDAAKLKILLDYGLPINNYYGYDGNHERLLHYNDKSPMIKEQTLFLEALRQKAVNCVNLLLESGADVSKKDSAGNDALIMMTFLSEKHVVEVANKVSLKYSFDVNASNVWNSTALGAAVRGNNYEYVRWLIKNGADYRVMNGVEDADCIWLLKRPIIFDAVNSRKDIFDLLLTKSDAPIKSLDCKGCGILSWLRPKADDYETRFKFLVSKGAKITEADKLILIVNMRSLHDCGDRISMICSYIKEPEILKTALRYAKKKNYSSCIDVIERRLEEINGL